MCIYTHTQSPEGFLTRRENSPWPGSLAQSLCYPGRPEIRSFRDSFECCSERHRPGIVKLMVSFSAPWTHNISAQTRQHAFDNPQVEASSGNGHWLSCSAPAGGLRRTPQSLRMRSWIPWATRLRLDRFVFISLLGTMQTPQNVSQGSKRGHGAQWELGSHLLASASKMAVEISEAAYSMAINSCEKAVLDRAGGKNACSVECNFL